MIGPRVYYFKMKKSLRLSLSSFKRQCRKKTALDGLFFSREAVYDFHSESPQNGHACDVDILSSDNGLCSVGQLHFSSNC